MTNNMHANSSFITIISCLSDAFSRLVSGVNTSSEILHTHLSCNKFYQSKTRDDLKNNCYEVHSSLFKNETVIAYFSKSG